VNLSRVNKFLAVFGLMLVCQVQWGDDESVRELRICLVRKTRYLEGMAS
jgi:hypothetical protein